MKTLFKTRAFGVMLPALVFTSSGAHSVSEAATVRKEDVSTANITPPLLPIPISTTLPASPTITLNRPVEEWTKQMESRFEELGILEAYEKLSPEQKIEIEKLTTIRRMLMYPRSAEEILWEYNQRKVAEELMTALEKYAKFHDVQD